LFEIAKRLAEMFSSIDGKLGDLMAGKVSGPIV
jgi:hypothetical protein